MSTSRRDSSSKVSNTSSFSARRAQNEEPQLNPSLDPRDSTLLNHLHRVYARDPHAELSDRFKIVKKIEATIEKLIRSPFIISDAEKVEAYQLWGKKALYPITKKDKKAQTDEEIQTSSEKVGEGSSLIEKKGKFVTHSQDDDDLGVISKQLQSLGRETDNAESTEDTFDIVRDFVAVHKKYLVIHFSYYLKHRNFHYPAEFALCEFSVQNGLGKTISGLIDIGKVPFGCEADVRERRQEILVPHPPYNKDFNAYEHVLRPIEEFCSQYFASGNTVLLFALKEHIPIVHHGLQWLLQASEVNCKTKFYILPFSDLVKALANESQTPQYKQKSDPENNQPKCFVQHECYLDSYLHRQEYSYMPELACKHHAQEENEGGIFHCAESMVKRCVFNASQVLVEMYKIRPLLEHHYPRIVIKTRLPLHFGDDRGNVNFPACDTSDTASMYSQSETEYGTEYSSSSTTESRAMSASVQQPPSIISEDVQRDLTVAGPGWNSNEVLNYFQVRQEIFGKGPCDVHDMRPDQKKESETVDSEDDDDFMDDSASVMSASSSSSSILFFRKLSD